MTTLRIGSLFAGIGGLELGLEQAGVGHTVWQVEREPYPRQVLAAHWPDAARYEDVITTDWTQVAPVDVVCGGFPCQPFSIAGLQKGTNDDRWLWPAFADCVRVVRPRYVVVENVAALVADSDAFGWLLSDLHDLGFDAEWSLVSACSVGAPHARQRVLVVAHRPLDDGEDHMPRLRADEDRAGVEPRGGRGVEGRHGWLPEPPVGRVAHGVPSRMVRGPLFALGNAVVPAVGRVAGDVIVRLERLAVAEPLRDDLSECIGYGAQCQCGGCKAQDGERHSSRVIGARPLTPKGVVA